MEQYEAAVSKEYFVIELTNAFLLRFALIKPSLPCLEGLSVLTGTILCIIKHINCILWTIHKKLLVSKTDTNNSEAHFTSSHTPLEKLIHINLILHQIHVVMLSLCECSGLSSAKLFSSIKPRQNAHLHLLTKS